MDVAEIRRWLRQFDDDSRIEVAFLLLRRMAERGFVNEGMRSRGYSKLAEMINARRQDLGLPPWRVVRGRLDNLCVAYVDSDVKSGAAVAREMQKILRAGKCASLVDVGSWMRSHADDSALIVVVDDFAGTGQTLANGLREFQSTAAQAVMSRYLGEGRLACYVMYAFAEAVDEIRAAAPGFEVVAANYFAEEVRAFEEDSGIFSEERDRRFARDVMMQIGRELAPQMPIGFGDLGALVLFHNTVPNNTLPVFWAAGRVSERPWVPLFPRA